jgi:hypothetical protein
MKKGAILISILLFFLLVSCKHYKKNASHKQVSDASIGAGEKLAQQYCGSCHLRPDPSLINSKSWEKGVLPEMGPRLGIFYFGMKQYPSFKYDVEVDKNYYPSKPVLTNEEWQHIMDYYTALAPDSISPAKKPLPITMNEKLFNAVTTSFPHKAPGTSFIGIKNDKLITCDVPSKKMFVFNNALQLIDSINTNGPVTDVLDDSNAYILCNTGVLNPNNGRYGSLEKVVSNRKHIAQTVFKNLRRPVQVVSCDLNRDKKQDYLVCEFGNLQGALSWLENTDTGFVRQVIRAAPGAIKAYVNDYNHDGLPDIWALFAQGDESVFLFTNKGNGVFEPKQVLRFLPSYGSSYFELDDFNKDGFADIVYTCGDNADYSAILKPYHGVYIFLNDGKNNFTQKYFYPINGCYKAIAKDFDNDGDLDIATIAFFADYARQPEEGFVYLKNEGNFNFQPYSLPAAKNGRWLTMDAGDFDGDGKTDLVLGNFSIVGVMIRSSVNWTKQPPFLLLKNMQ